MISMVQDNVEQLIDNILHEIWTETQKGRHEIPMAALCKRLNVRMSTLQRYLTGLASHGLLETACDDAGRWTVSLTAQGRHAFDQAA